MKKIILILTIFIILYGCNADNKKKQKNNSNNSDVKTMVKVKELKYEKFEHFVLVSGSVEAINEAFISPEIGGQIKKIHVKEGNRIKKGQILVSLNSTVIDRSISEVKTGLELARTIYIKRKGLWGKKIGSEIQYLEAKTNKESLENKLKILEAQLELSKITAPIDGIVDEIAKKEGELASPGQLLVLIVDLARVYVNADVSESYLAKISEGDRVEVSFSSFPELNLQTTIYRIGNYINPQNRTFKIQVILDNIGEKLKPNILALIKVRDYSDDQALIIPSLIIKNDINGPYVYVVENSNQKLYAKKRYIKPGIPETSNTQIDQGLHQGEKVIVEGYNLVKNGMEIIIQEN